MADAAVAPAPTYRAGDRVEIFYRFGDEEFGNYIKVPCASAGLIAPRYGMSDGWIEAVIARDYPGPNDNADGAAGHPLNRPIKAHYVDRLWYNRRGVCLDCDDENNITQWLHPRDVRPLVAGVARPVPIISFLVVRWGGLLEVGNTTEQWGPSNSSVSDTHIKMFFDGTTYSALGPNYEVFSVFVEKSEDLAKIHMPSIVGAMRGRHKAACYHLWPVAFEVGGERKRKRGGGARGREREKGEREKRERERERVCECMVCMWAIV